MVDRLSLLREMEPLAKPTGTQAESIRRTLDKAMIELTLTLPLASARTLPQTSRAELEIVVHDVLSPKDAEKLAHLWEPSRKVDADAKPKLKHDLIDLLHKKREVYAIPSAVGLDEARKLANGSRETLSAAIEHLAPLADLKALLRQWDKHISPKPTTRKGHVERLLALLEGATPAEKTPSERRR
jgi:hypothetical protein